MRPRDVCLPAMLADVVMAVLLTLPRPERAPDPPRRERHSAKEALSVTELKRGEDVTLSRPLLRPRRPLYAVALWP